MSARLAILIVIAIGRVAAAAPALVCTMDGRPLRAGGRAPLDHEVACVIEDADPRADAAKIAIAIERPLAVDPEIDPHPAARDGVRWIAAPFTTERCAPTRFSGELRRGADVVWSGALAVRPACPRVRFARAPVLACTEGGDVIGCAVTVARPPAGVVLRATFRRTPPATGPDTGPPAEVELEPEPEPDVDGAMRGAVDEDAFELTCGEVRVDAAITRDGGVVWTGHTSYWPQCPPKRR